MRLNTRLLTNLGLLVGLSVVLTRLFGVMIPLGGVGVLRLSFGEIPIILSGILFGPLAGGLTGALADLVGYAINPMGGPYFPGFTLTAALNGMLPALFLGRRRHGFGLGHLLLAIALTDLITSVVLNTLWISTMYGKAIMAILPMRVLARAILAPTYAVVVHLVANRHPMMVSESKGVRTG